MIKGPKRGSFSNRYTDQYLVGHITVLTLFFHAYYRINIVIYIVIVRAKENIGASKKF